MIDPLRAFISGAFIAGTERSIPLIATRFDVHIAHGLAIVSTTRTFRNDERESIEATITFPIPVHAVLFALEAQIDGRLLKAKAQRKSEARDTYEDALERGKSTVLHEEVLRGVHMLSVGHIPPGAEIKVSTKWTLTLTNINNSGHLRIPLTVGDIYGRSGLPDSDQLIHADSVQTGLLSVSCHDGQVTLRGGSLRNGEALIPLNAPIDLEVNGWATREMLGRTADGRKVTLRVEPYIADAALDVAVVIDRSGSMNERCSDGYKITKHTAIIRSLRGITSGIGLADAIDVWEFNDDLHRVGSTRDGHNLKAIFQRLSGPDGGTDIGCALEGVVAQSNVRDVLLITDGKSHELSIQALARTGRRFSVVLVGEDSLEANVGHLAALTGGEIFVASGNDLTGVFNQSLRSLRTSHRSSSPIADKLTNLSVRRAGMSITVSWHEPEESLLDTLETRAVAALAASIALPSLSDENAAQLAENEGLVSHLTSLVLVDEANTNHQGAPAYRKIPLPSPRTAIDSVQAALAAVPLMDRIDRGVRYSLDASLIRHFAHEPTTQTAAAGLSAPFGCLVQLVEEAPSRLRPSHIIRLLEEAGLEKEFEQIIRHAQDLGLTVEAVLSIVLARLLNGPLDKSLSAETRSACMQLQEFSERAMRAIREIYEHACTLHRLGQYSAELKLVQPSLADETAHALARFRAYQGMLDHIEQFINEKAERLTA